MGGRDIRLSAGGSSAVFDPDDGMRLTSLRLGGPELVVRDLGRGELWWGAFVMAPWTSDLPEGRFRFLDSDHAVPVDANGIASHGLARSTAWEWDGSTASSDLGEEWPFGGSVTLAPRLDTGALSVTMTLRAGERPMPGSIGWHPWFVRHLAGDPGRVVLPAGSLLQDRDAERRPTGLWRAVDDGPLNDGVRATGPIEIVWGRAGRLRIDSDGGHWIVFDTDPQGICVEPATGPAGTMDRLLMPGESLRLRLRVGWSAAGGAGGVAPSSLREGGSSS